jgi:two-component system, chemotaxis family, chemotaxis protein CheY
MKVLIVDDSRVMRQIVSRTLRQAGYTELSLLEASNGLEAYELVQSHQPDLVLSDWNMPEMNGFDLLRSLRGRGHEVAFGFVTSEGTQEMRAKAAAAGALFLVAKPFTAESFKDALTPVLG